MSSLATQYEPPKKKSKLELTDYDYKPSSQLNSHLMSQPFKIDQDSNYFHDGPEDLANIGNYFDALRARCLGVTDKSPTDNIDTPEKMDLSKTGDTFESNNENGIFVNSLTAKLTPLGYNDLNCKIYELHETFKNIGFLNFDNKKFTNADIKLYHSGDELITEDQIEYLLHGLYIQYDKKFKIKITFTNIIDENKEITSRNTSKPMQDAFDKEKDKIKFEERDKKPKYLILCSQVTYDKFKSLNQLSIKDRRKIDPSCGLIADKKVYSCEWNDKAHMNTWAKIFIYEN